jgi:hypothetical protein
MNNFDHIVVVLWMMFGIYMLVLIAVLADLWSGVRKAKRKKSVRTSEGYKRTVIKLGRYFNTLIALTVIDAMQIIGIWYLDCYYGYSIPIFPLITLLGALGIGLIEIKSIYENRADTGDIDEVAKLASELYASKDDVNAMSKALMNFLNSKKSEL